jgi:TonB family protein
VKLSRRLLFVAFALSLLIHFIFAVVVHPWRNPEANDVEVVSIQHRSAVTQMQTPPPPPKATPVPHPTPAVRPAPAKPHAANGESGGTGVAATAPPPTVAPVATPGGTTCSGADIGAAVTENAPQPDIPSDVRASGTSGVAAIEVRLDAQGSVTATTVSQSSGDSSLDVVALAMARGTRYSPALHACKPVASAYTYRVRFYAW